MSLPEIKKCPFKRRGGNGIVQYNEDASEGWWSWFVECKECGTQGPSEDIKFFAIEAWNDRLANDN